MGTAEEQTELRPYYVFGGRAEVPAGGQEVRIDAYVPAEGAPPPTATPLTGPVPTLAAASPTGG